MNVYDRIWKRVLDILLSAAGTLLLSWLLLLVALVIWIDDGSPVLFTQKRIGKGKSLFNIHKFRTMRRDAPKNVPTHLMKNFNRCTTRVGRFLRRSSLDELPQLWDILRGRMSVVGPRPALWNQDDLIEARDRCHANDVKPGLTGWAQINGRDEIEISAKAALDGYYAGVLRQGGWRAFLFDCKCFFRTFAKALSQNGVKEGT